MRGQITIPLIYASVGLIGAIIAPVLWFNNTEAKNQGEHSEISERVIVLETDIPNIKDNMSEIKDDLKDIKRALKIP